MPAATADRETVDTDEDRDDVPWTRRTVPLLVAVVVVVALLSLLSSSVRHQLGLSLTREPQQYVELSFGDGDGATALPSCPTTPVRRVTVPFVVDSHLDGDRRLAWTMSVSRPDGGRTIDRVTGTVASVPDRSVTAQGQVRLPARGRYAVEIRLDGREERLRVNCQVPARG